jgi:acyl-CoA synthetase (AMP-forming)/AMP-acid ligase II
LEEAAGWQGVNAYDLCAIPAAMFPEAECLVAGDLRLDYAALDAWSGALAQRLDGIAPGRVVVCDVNTAGLAVLALAAWRAGRCIVPINVRARGDELAYLLDASDAAIVFAGRRYLDVIRAGAPAGRSAEPSPARPGADAFAGETVQRPVDVDESAVALGLFTSGSTARPKLVELTHGNLFAHVTATTELASDPPHGAVVIAAPLSHIAAFGSIATGLFGGRRLVLVAEFEPESWLRAVESEAATHAFLVPTMLRRIVEHPGFTPARVVSLQTVTYGAAPMPQELLERILAAFPASVGFANAFGQTETTSTVTLLSPEDHRLEGTAEEIAERRARLRSVGRAIEGVEVAVLDETGSPCPPRTVGEVAVRGPRVMRGYAGISDAHGAALEDGWLRTRDLGFLDEAGYLFLAGRVNDLIIRAGENVAPAEVEAVLAGHPAVADVAVAGVPDEELGERIGAVLVPRSGATLDPADVVAFARARLAAFKKPEVIAVVAEIPRSPLGKVRRPLVREILERDGVAVLLPGAVVQ